MSLLGNRVEFAETKGRKILFSERDKKLNLLCKRIVIPSSISELFSLVCYAQDHYIMVYFWDKCANKCHQSECVVRKRNHGGELLRLNLNT